MTDGLTAHAARTIDDIKSEPALLDEQEWAHARQFLVAAAEDPYADHLRWLSDAEGPVASVEVFLHQYPIGAANVGMCLPEWPFVPPKHRGKGYFRAIMADLARWMPEAGYPLAYAHGRKGLYTGVGYVPCFHHGVLLIRTSDALRLMPGTEATSASRADVDAHAEALRRPHPLGRGLQCRDEDWSPDARNLLIVTADGGDQLRGFAVVGGGLFGPGSQVGGPSEEEPDARTLTVTDTFAHDLESAAALLKAIARRAKDTGCGWLRVNCRPDEEVVRAAILVGGEMRSFAAQERDFAPGGEDVDAFRLVDLRMAIEQLLPELDRRWRDRGSTGATAMGLHVDDVELWLALAGGLTVLESPQSSGLTARLSRGSMTRAIMGYASPSELALLDSECVFDRKAASALDALFPATKPHLIHESYAFAKVGELGLIP